MIALVWSMYYRALGIGRYPITSCTCMVIWFDMGTMVPCLPDIDELADVILVLFMLVAVLHKVLL